jgi:restriction system protein
MADLMPPGSGRFFTAGMDQRVYPQTADISVETMPAMLNTLIVDLAQPALLLRSVVTLGEKTDTGHVIEAVTIAWYEIVKLIKTDRHAMRQLDWRTWEEIIGGAYKAAGFDEVIVTPRSGDLGRDLIATRRDGFSIRIIDQVKSYAPGNLVPADDVRSMLGVLTGDRNVSKGIVTTTSDFAPGVRTDTLLAPFMPNRLELRSGTELLKWLEELAAKRGAG